VDDEGHDSMHGAEHDSVQLAADTDILDKQALANLYEMTGEDDEFMGQLLDSYLTTAVSLLASLVQGVALEDADAVRLAAHTLKSGSADVGALTVSRLCAELEALGRTDDLAEAPALVARLQAMMPPVREAVAAVRDDVAAHTFNPRMTDDAA
jgi:HPt (histidine-containing phosphotransfer) domain-containing protein